MPPVPQRPSRKRARRGIRTTATIPPCGLLGRSRKPRAARWTPGTFPTTPFMRKCRSTSRRTATRRRQRSISPSAARISRSAPASATSTSMPTRRSRSWVPPIQKAPSSRPIKTRNSPSTGNSPSGTPPTPIRAARSTLISTSKRTGRSRSTTVSSRLTR